MKVLIHMNHGINRSYMLNFGSRVSRGTIQKVLSLDQEDAVAAICGYANLLASVPKIEISADQMGKAALEADFIVGHQGYISERLA